MKPRYGISLLMAGFFGLQVAPVRAALDFNNYDALHLSSFRFSHGRQPGDWLNPMELPGSVSDSTIAARFVVMVPSANNTVPVFDFVDRPMMAIEPSMLILGGAGAGAGMLASTAPATRSIGGDRRNDPAAGATLAVATAGFTGMRQLGFVDIPSTEATDSTVSLQITTGAAGVISADGVNSASALDATTLVSASAFLVTAGLAAGALRRRQ